MLVAASRVDWRGRLSESRAPPGTGRGGFTVEKEHADDKSLTKISAKVWALC